MSMHMEQFHQSKIEKEGCVKEMVMVHSRCQKGDQTALKQSKGGELGWVGLSWAELSWAELSCPHAKQREEHQSNFEWKGEDLVIPPTPNLQTDHECLFDF